MTKPDTMAQSPIGPATRAALDELADVADRIDDTAVDNAIACIADARRLALYGCGREALQLRGFAMRLFHLGRDVAMVGDLNAPHLSEGDLLVCSSRPGTLATVDALIGVARGAGARVMLLTAEPSSPTAGLADDLLVIPAQTMASDEGVRATSVLPMGSLYEGALFVLFEIMVAKLQARLGVDAAAMRARHTNLE